MWWLGQKYRQLCAHVFFYRYSLLLCCVWVFVTYTVGAVLVTAAPLAKVTVPPFTVVVT